MFKNHSLSLKDISKLVEEIQEPVGRKYCLNFAYADEYEIDSKKLSDLFDPDLFMVKITPIHNNNSCRENGIKTTNGYESYKKYEEIENNLVESGFDTLVFIPSMDEENGCITCGNAILGGSTLRL
jgi:23S rRNA (adenine2503-C2)-methyltransferase